MRPCIVCHNLFQQRQIIREHFSREVGTGGKRLFAQHTAAEPVDGEDRGFIEGNESIREPLHRLRHVQPVRVRTFSRSVRRATSSIDAS